MMETQLRVFVIVSSCLILSVVWLNAVVCSVAAEESVVSGSELYDLGMLYRFGDNEHPRNAKVAAEYFQQSASAGIADALLQLGYMHEAAEIGPRNLSFAHRLFQQAADLGSANGMMEVAMANALAHGTNQDDAKAITYYYFAAMGGSHEAQLALAYRYRYGYGVPKSCSSSAEYYLMVADHAIVEIPNLKPAEFISLTDEHVLAQKSIEPEVVSFYEQAADHGNVDAMRYTGYQHLHDHPQRAAEYFQRAAEREDPAALAMMGHMYISGLGVPANNNTAREYFERSAKLGHPAAYNGLGYMYLYGVGVKKDPKEAARLFGIAAQKGYADSQYNLGFLYHNGEGVEKDLQAAIRQYILAAEQGQPSAIYQLGVLHLRGSGVALDCERSVQYFSRVVDKGSLGKLVEDAFEKFTDGDFEDALLLYEKAAELGFEVAQSNAAFMYERGLGTEIMRSTDDGPMDVLSAHLTPEEQMRAEKDEQRFQRAIRRKREHWYKRSARLGNVDSLVKMGDIFYYDHSNMDQAVFYYRKAADMHNAQALFNLGYMHENALGLPQDYHLAKRFYDLAVQSSDKAYLPVRLALWKMSWRQALDPWVSWFYGSSSPSSSASPSSSPSPKHADPARPAATESGTVPGALSAGPASSQSRKWFSVNWDKLSAWGAVFSHLSFLDYSLIVVSLVLIRLFVVRIRMPRPSDQPTR
eukprot:ANDGO_06828.mRNA.1 ERAD-associated E3 ubiquitin-protein ligase component HRD3A